MTVYLFPKDAKSFNGEGFGSLIDIVEDVEVTETIRGFFELKFAYALNGVLANEIKEEAYIVTKVNEIQDDYLSFRIYEIEPDYVEHTVHVQARLHILDDMRNVTVKSSTYSPGMGIGHSINAMFLNSHIGNYHRIADDVDNAYLIERDDDTMFNVLFDNDGLIVRNNVTPYYIDGGMRIVKTRGNTKRDILTEQNYLEKFTINTSRNDMVTQIIPYTTTRKDKLTQRDDGDRYDRETIEEKVYGDIITSPKVEELGYPIVARFMEFKNDVIEELKHGETDYNRYKFESVSDLNKVTGDFFTENKGIDEYTVVATVETLGLTVDEYKKIGSLNLYDIVTFYIQEYDLEIDLMVSEKTYHESSNMTTRLVFESNKDTLQRVGSRINAQAPSNQELSNWIHNHNFINQVKNNILGADGKRRWFVDTLPDPSQAKEGDIVFLETEEGTSIWVFEDGSWVEKLPLNFGKIVEDIVSETEAKVQAMEEEFAKIQERNDAELEAFRKELESLNLELTEEEIRAMFDKFELSDEQLESIADRINLDVQNFDDLKAQLEAVRETSRVNAEMIGNDGVTRYNKNLLMGEFDRKILFTDDHITIEANDGGFKRGETYTVSFEAICEMLAKANVSFNFDKETVRRLLITMTPDFEKLPIVESNGEKVQAHLGEYAVKLVSDWYQTQSSRLNVAGDSTVDVNLQYREIADGNLDMTIQGEWAEAPEIILDGGGG